MKDWEMRKIFTKKMNKTCSTCGEVKPISEMRKNRNQCKACVVEYHKQYYQDNKEHKKQYNKQYHKQYYQDPDNKERIKQYNKQWRQDNKEYDKQWLQNLPAATYLIMNTINGKVYIGQSTRYSRRWTEHKKHLRKNTHPNKHLQRDYDEHGKDAFVFEVIEELPPDTSSELLLEKEREQIIEHLKRDVILYNTLN